jgi:hypothetical protein
VGRVDDNLEERTKRAVLRIADVVQDIDLKLGHMIDYRRQDYCRNCDQYHP